MTEIKRVNYFNYQFLQAKDFQDEQAYHLNMRRLHNQRLHTNGVVWGLEVKITDGNDKKISVDPGLAIDGSGREIVLDKTVELPLSTDTYVTANWIEQPTDEYSGNGIKDFTRRTEKADIGVSKQPADDSVRLGKVEADGRLNIDPSVRHFAGAKMNPSAEITARKLTVIADANHAEFRSPDGGEAIGINFNAIYAAGPGQDNIILAPRQPRGQVVIAQGGLMVEGGAATFKKGLAAEDIATFKTGLTAEDIATFKRGLTAEDIATFRRGLTVEDGAATFKKGLAAEDIATFQRGLTAEDIATFKRGLTAEDIATFKKGLTAEDTATFRGLTAGDIATFKRGLTAEDIATFRRGLTVEAGPATFKTGLTVTQESWHAVTDFKNNWQNLTDLSKAEGYAPAGFFKDSLGIVHLRGIVTHGLIDWGKGVIFILPTDYRPECRSAHTVALGEGAIGQLDVDRNGEVIACFGKGVYLSLDGVTFRAAG